MKANLEMFDAQPQSTFNNPYLRMVSAVVLALCPISAVQSAQAQSFGLLYSFEDPPDGAVPMSSLLVNGNFGYGTTYEGGAYGSPNNGYGTIFKIGPSGKETAVHSFSSTPDGANPSGALARDSSGNIYGTTRNGGTCGQFTGNCGTVFKLDSAGNETVIYSFQAGTTDAENPGSGVILDAAGNLYGPAGGGKYGQGAIFKIDTSGKESVFYSFGTNSGDGVYPFGPLAVDAAGSVYGVTQEGGACNSSGTIFKIDSSGNETTLYTFCGGAAGATPSGPLVRDRAGNLYGVTTQGGDFSCPPGDGQGCGTIFQLSSAGKMTVLHAFQGGAADGAENAGIGLGGGLGLIPDAAGNLYGATPLGGSNSTAGNGTVFKLNASGYTLLHTFTGGDDDGSTPEVPLLWFSGSLYGTTSSGGASSNGTVFKLTP